MYESRLLSCPAYFWYSRGMPPVDRLAWSGFRIYHPETRSIPSGFAGTHKTMTSLRKRRVSASERLTSW